MFLILKHLNLSLGPNKQKNQQKVFKNDHVKLSLHLNSRFKKRNKNTTQLTISNVQPFIDMHWFILK